MGGPLAIFGLLKALLNGRKTYLAAIGLALLGIYQMSIDEFGPAAQSFLAALAASGLRNAITKVMAQMATVTATK